MNERRGDGIFEEWEGRFCSTAGRRYSLVLLFRISSSQPLVARPTAFFILSLSLFYFLFSRFFSLERFSGLHATNRIAQRQPESSESFFVRDGKVHTGYNDSLQFREGVTHRTSRRIPPFSDTNEKYERVRARGIEEEKEWAHEATSVRNKSWKDAKMAGVLHSSRKNLIILERHAEKARIYLWKGERKRKKGKRWKEKKREKEKWV